MQKDNAREIIAKLAARFTRLYKYYILLFLFNLSFVSCGPDINEVSYVSHERVTIQSNLKFIHLADLLFDSTTVYPHTLFDTLIYSGVGVSIYYILYPAKDSGYINFKYYDSYGEHPGPVQLRDSFLIKTPADTTYIGMHGHASNPHFSILH